MVELTLRGAAINTIYADTEGRFGFFNLAANPYHVIIRDDDYYPVDELANVDPIAAPFTMIQISLRPREKEKTPSDPAGRRAGGSNPYLIDPTEYNRRFPKKAIKSFEKGLQAARAGKSQDAISRYKETIKIAPDYYPAHNNLGSLYLSRSDFASAEAEFQEAIRIDPADAQAYFNLGNVFMLTRHYPESRTALDSGLQRRPDSAFGRFLEGCLFARTGNLESAEKSLRSAITLDPSMSQGYLQLANLYIQQNRRTDAIAELEAFLKAFPSAPLASKARDVLRRLQDPNAPVRAD